MANLETHDEGDARILAISGEVDMDSSPDVKDGILGALKGASTLKVLLKDVSYIDSSGIAVLIQGMKDANRANVAYSLLDPSPNVKSVIELAMLQQVFTIEESGG
ncbi:MAG: anti-anti-sigma factor [Planctomycetes bacterium]|nr:anti-anti-sigma factor [Planctomycetota bacterium]